MKDLKENLNRLDNVGVDRMIISVKLNSYSINFERIKADTDTIIRDSKDLVGYEFTDIKTNEKICINKIEIENVCNKLPFNTLKMGVVKDSQRNYRVYCRLDITLPRVVENTNYNNINDNETLKYIFDVIQKKLNDYGLDTDIKNSTIQEIELNNNIKLKGAFESYYKPLNYIYLDVIGKNLKSEYSKEFKPNNAYTGFKVANSSRSIKFYDKKTDIYRLYKITTDETLRIEYRLLNNTIMQFHLDINTINDLINIDMESIQNAFREMFIKDIYNPLIKDIKRQEKALIKEFNSSKRLDIFKAIDRKPIDVLILLNALKNSNKNKGNFIRDSKRIIKYMYDRQKSSNLTVTNADVFFNNINKINEILENMGVDKIEYQFQESINKELNKIYKALD